MPKVRISQERYDQLMQTAKEPSLIADLYEVEQPFTPAPEQEPITPTPEPVATPEQTPKPEPVKEEKKEKKPITYEPVKKTKTAKDEAIERIKKQQKTK